MTCDCTPEQAALGLVCPHGHHVEPYRCLLADPPWLERGGGKVKRGADRWYPLLTVEKIAEVMLGSSGWRPADDSHLWLYATDNFLPDALWLIGTLGFEYKRTFCWVKVKPTFQASAEDDALDEQLRMGIGQYGRGCHEHLILATRGRGQSPDVWMGNRDVRSVFHATHPLDAQGKRIHSAKPAKGYFLIERVSKGPRIEFFARGLPRFGWNTTGNEALVDVVVEAP